MSYESKVIFKVVMDILSTSKTLEEAMERVAAVANAGEDVVTPPRKREEKEPQREE